MEARFLQQHKDCHLVNNVFVFCCGYRGRAKVQIKACLSAMAQNLKRLVLLIYHWLRTLQLTAENIDVRRCRLQL
jgi:hypothetical protein